MESFVVEQGTFFLYAFLYEFRHDFFFFFLGGGGGGGEIYICGYFLGSLLILTIFMGYF